MEYQKDMFVKVLIESKDELKKLNSFHKKIGIKEKIDSFCFPIVYEIKNEVISISYTGNDIAISLNEYMDLVYANSYRGEFIDLINTCKELKNDGKNKWICKYFKLSLSYSEMIIKLYLYNNKSEVFIYKINKKSYRMLKDMISLLKAKLIK